jgi:glycerophosphoryl diester phosphodiesterase
MMGDWIQVIDQASLPFFSWLQGFQTDGLTSVMRFFSYLGTEYFFMLLLPLLYWTLSKRWGMMVAFSLVFSSYLVGVIKWTFNIPRPPSPPVKILWTETSPSFVSGHAATAMAVWGTLASLVNRVWFWLVAAFLIFAIGFSRLYLGVHYPLDVIGGWLVGLFVAWAVLAAVPRIGSAVKDWSAGKMLIAALALALLMVLIHPRWPKENLWPAPNAVQLGGLLFGMLAGLVWDVKSLNFQVTGPWGKRLLRLLLGLILMAVFYLVPKIILDQMGITSYPVEQSLRFLRYALVGFVVSGLGPWLFARVHLAD